METLPFISVCWVASLFTVAYCLGFRWRPVLRGCRRLEQNLLPEPPIFKTVRERKNGRVSFSYIEGQSVFRPSRSPNLVCQPRRMIFQIPDVPSIFSGPTQCNIVCPLPSKEGLGGERSCEGGRSPRVDRPTDDPTGKEWSGLGQYVCNGDHAVGGFLKARKSIFPPFSDLFSKIVNARHDLFAMSFWVDENSGSRSDFPNGKAWRLCSHL